MDNTLNELHKELRELKKQRDNVENMIEEIYFRIDEEIEKVETL